MLTRKHRPVPSKAALQILYQLAYISSGTAVGVGFLCAEERRRRTQMVQRIADNAKRIRQSPRYAHNAAAAAVRETEEVFYLAPADISSRSRSHNAATAASVREVEKSRQETARSTRKRRRAAGLDNGAKGPELPSVVAEAYAQHQSFSKGGTTRVKRSNAPRKRVASSHTPPGDVKAELSPNVDVWSFDRGSSGALAGQVRQDNHLNRRDISQAERSHLGGQRGGFTHRAQVLADATAERVDERSRPVPIHKQRPAAVHRTHFKTLCASTAAESLDHIQDVDVIGDIDLFQACAKDTPLHLDALELRRIWRDLVTLSARKGLLRKATLMLEWIAKRKFFDWLSQDVLESLCLAHKALLRRARPSEVFDFYVEVFKLAKDTSFASSLLILDNALTWDFDATIHERAEALLGTPPPLQQGALLSCLRALCLKRASNDDGNGRRFGLGVFEVHRQSELLLAVAPMIKGVAGFENFLDEIFENALSAGRLNICARLIRCADRYIPSTGSIKRYEDFLCACDAREAYGLVRDLFEGPLRALQPEVMQLSGRCRKIVLKARAALGAITHKEVQAMRLPKHESGPLIVRGLRIRLRHVWHSTYDRNQVNAELRNVRNSLVKYGNDESRRIFEAAKLEFCIFSDQPGSVLKALSALHAASPHEPGIISLAAVLFAKRGAWSTLNKLLVRAREDKLFDDSVDGTRRFNAVIGLHARAFTAVETWRFVTELVDQHGFHPNFATTEAMLKAFVSQRTIGLITRWFAFVHTLGVEVRLDSNLVSSLLRRYHRDNQPSHVLMITFCRSLVQRAPALTGPEYLDVLKECIGHDLRRARKNNHLARQVVRPEHIEARLRRVESLKEDFLRLPGPGKTLDEEPVFAREERRTSDNSADVDFLSSGNGAVDDHKDTRCKRDLIGSPADDPIDTADSNERSPEQYNVSLPEQSQVTTNDHAEAAKDHEQSSRESEVRFSDLRQSYGDFALQANSESLEEQELGQEALEGSDHVSKPARDMMLALSTGKYNKVIDLYQASMRETESLAFSPLALELAVEASLRRSNGDSTEAMQFMNEAHRAGLNATCAMGPMFINQMRSMDVINRVDVDRLRVTAAEYYRLNDENGWPVSHHVGVAAASMMIKGGLPKHGLNLLDAIFRSDAVRRRPLEIEAMSVYVQGYALARNITGIKWVVDQVLAQNLRIDYAFCHILKRCAKFFSSNGRGDYGGARWQRSRQQQAYMRYFLSQCRARRLEQRVGSYKLGKALVNALVRVARYQARPSRAKLEASVFEGDRNHPAERNAAEKRAYTNPTPQTIIDQRSRRRRQAALRCLRIPRAGAKQRQYRKFLQRQMAGGEKTCLSFRYSLPGTQARRIGKSEASTRNSHNWLELVGGPPMNAMKWNPAQTTADEPIT